MNPRHDSLPDAQQRFWTRLAETPEMFTLYGDTAIALRLGHRQSVDFDLFADRSFEPDALKRHVSWLKDAEIVRRAPDTLSVRLGADEPFLVSFFGVPELGRVRQPDRAEDTGLKIASLLDLAGSKASVVQVRASAKDYIDLDALIAAGVELEQALAAGRVLYGDGFNPLITLKALSYYEQGDLDAVPNEVRKRLQRAAATVDASALPELHPVKPRKRAP